MLGFIVGTACLVGLIKVIRRGRQGCGPGYGHGCGYTSHGCGPGGGGRHGWHGSHAWHGRGGFGRGFESDGFGGDGSPMMLRGLFVKLGTTPGQERVMVDALRELCAAVKKSAEEKAKSAKQVAEALRGEDFKTENMGEAFVHLDAGAEVMRDASFAALAKIHAVLDDGQRRILADFVARGGAALEALAEQV